MFRTVVYNGSMNIRPHSIGQGAKPGNVSEMGDKLLAWHFLNDKGTLRDGVTNVEAGQTLRVTGKIVLCERGLHASIKPLDALQYAPGAIICRVEMGGTIVHGDDKLVASERTVLWMVDATNMLHEFACRCAEGALTLLRKKGYVIDPRSWAAIEAKRKWLKGAITGQELAAAWAAAGDAAWAAAGDAARAAVEVAAWDAVWDDSEDAARDAARAAQNNMLEQMLFELQPVS
jgi:hypothetical protein